VVRQNWKSVIRPALLRLRQMQAAWHQRRFVGRYVAVTGSCGKTTTTALTAQLLRLYGSSTLGHDNAGTKLLRSVRGVRAPTDYMVQETSGHEPGAIAVTTRTLRVDVAVVTSLGFEHSASFRKAGTDFTDAIATEKGKLVEAVAKGGFACLNFDDARVRAMAERTRQRVIGFGVSPDAQVRATNVEFRWPSRLRFDVTVGGMTYPVQTRFVGSMMLTNILGALAVVHGFGHDLAPAVAKLAEIEPVRDRMGVHRGRDGKTYILDTQKAPLWSTEKLVDDLPAIGIDDLTFVLGDMSDMTGMAKSRYRRVVRALSERVGTVVVAGKAAHYAAVLSDQGFANVVNAPTAFDVSAWLDTRPPGGVVLLKANKTSQLWRVLDQVTPVDEVAT
jgi:UDP-N-acetylmuramoyl-tripeptide--D-alanyl-D-alanine ligase